MPRWAWFLLPITWLFFVWGIWRYYHLSYRYEEWVKPSAWSQISDVWKAWDWGIQSRQAPTGITQVVIQSARSDWLAPLCRPVRTHWQIPCYQGENAPTEALQITAIWVTEPGCKDTPFGFEKLWPYLCRQYERKKRQQRRWGVVKDGFNPHHWLVWIQDLDKPL